MMLVHIGQTDVAERVHNAWLRTLEDGIHTYDVYKEGVSRKSEPKSLPRPWSRVGQLPQTLKAAKYQAATESAAATTSSVAAPVSKKELVGVDVFLDWTKGSATELGESLEDAQRRWPQTQMMSNRGVKVWPGGHAETFCSDHWRCRFCRERATVQFRMIRSWHCSSVWQAPASISSRLRTFTTLMVNAAFARSGSIGEARRGDTETRRWGRRSGKSEKRYD